MRYIRLVLILFTTVFLTILFYNELLFYFLAKPIFLKESLISAIDKYNNIIIDTETNCIDTFQCTTDMCQLYNVPNFSYIGISTNDRHLECQESMSSIYHDMLNENNIV